MPSEFQSNNESILFPLGELSRRSAGKFGDRPVFKRWNGSEWQITTFRELERKSDRLARWLLDNGLKVGDRVVIIGENGPEWALAYLAVHIACGVAVPADNQLTPHELKFILEDAEATILFATPKHLKNLSGFNPDLRKICLTEAHVEGTTQFKTLFESESTSSTAFPVADLDSMASILYTSGTTGHSKGVMLTHRNIISNVYGASMVIPLGPDDTFLSVLPVHHSLECTAGFLLPVYTGASITFARSMKSADLLADIRQTGVTILVGVPILFEKMMASIAKGVKKKGRSKELVFNTLMATAKIHNNLGTALFRGIREKAGFGTVKFFVSGGGPLDPVVGRFFLRFGVKILQGYGLTETSPVTHVNPPDRIKVETVGKTLIWVECRIGEPTGSGVGEVEVRGPNVFPGYYRNREATESVMTEDGWLKTGDLGTIDKDGYLTLMGRKKNIIVTGGGKNIYPEEVEFHLNRQPIIGQSLVLGSTRDSGFGEDVAALIYPDQEYLDQLRAEHQPRELTAGEIDAMVKQAIAAASHELAEYKRVKKFKIVEAGFEMTSSKKIKRYLYSGDMLK